MSGGGGPGGTRRSHALQLFKTDEIRRKPDLKSTSMCSILAREGQCLDPECRFAHSEEQLRATSGFFKMKMCGFAQTKGCKNGVHCRFAHSIDELRPPSQAQVKKPVVASIQEPAQGQSMSSHGGQRPLGMPGSMKDNRATTAAGQLSSGGCASGLVNSSGARALQHHSMWSDIQDSSHGPMRGQRSGGSGYNAQDSSDSAGSAEGGSQEGSSSRLSRHSSLTEVPRSDSTSMHSGTTAFSSDSSGNSADATTASGSNEQQVKSKHKKRDQEQGWEKLSVNTLLITNVPSYLTQGALLSMFEDLTPSMRGKLDFFYCPWDAKASRNLGYATINFSSPASALEFQKVWSNKELCQSGHWQKHLRILKANVQGLQANLAFFSKVKITEGEEQRFRPLFRDREGLLTTLRLSDDAQVLDSSNIPQPRTRRPVLTAASPPQPPSLEEAAPGACPTRDPGPPVDGKDLPGAMAAGAYRQNGCQGDKGDLWGFNAVDFPMGADGCRHVAATPLGYPLAAAQPLGPAPAQGAAQAQDSMRWLPMMMLAVPGGAGGGMPWLGMGEGQHELKVIPDPPGGYQTPELSETEARDATFTIPVQQRVSGVPPFQPMVQCMMMNMEAFVVPVDWGGYGSGGVSSGTDEQGFAYSGAAPPTRGVWQDPYISTYC